VRLSVAANYKAGVNFRPHGIDSNVCSWNWRVSVTHTNIRCSSMDLYGAVM